MTMTTDMHLADDYSAVFTDENKFIEDLDHMEENSSWIPGITAKEIRLEPVETQIDAWDKANQYGMDYDTLAETAMENSSRLIMSVGNIKSCVRKCAISSLEETAKLTGYALGRMTPTMYAATLNNGFSVARGESLILMRYGKIASCHSDADGGYAIMPISDMIRKTQVVAAAKFGEVRFVNGYNSHSYTECVWELPDAQSRLCQVYDDALESVNSTSHYAINFMPALKFSSSDTSAACATLTPIFEIDRGRYIKFCDGVKVKHIKRGEKYGVARFEAEIPELYAKFDDIAEIVKKLAKVNIYHPENTIISLCRKFNISKRYGDSAIEEIKPFMYSGGCLSAHDIYIAMTIVPYTAKEKKASQTVINSLEESITKIAKITDWSDYDVNGVVAWKD